MVLKVSDNGKGMPNNIKKNGVGLKLIEALGKNLNATISYSDSSQTDGTEVTLKIYNYTIL